MTGGADPNPLLPTTQNRTQRPSTASASAASGMAFPFPSANSTLPNAHSSLRDEAIRTDDEGNLLLINRDQLEQKSKWPLKVAIATFVIYVLMALYLGMLCEDWDFETSIYFAIVTLSTVGYGDYTLQHENRFCGALFVLVGVVFVSTAMGVIFDHVTAERAAEKELEDDTPTAADVHQEIQDLFDQARNSFIQLAIVVGVGTVGFYFLEVDVAHDYQTTISQAFYWASVTVTTVGYGDVVPKCDAARTFASLFICVAFLWVANALLFLGTMPLELRKLQQQNRVLVQFGDCLDADELQALLSCNVLKGIRAKARADANDVTRGEFALWVLLHANVLDKRWLNKCFCIFDELDIDGSGILDEKDIEVIVEALTPQGTPSVDRSRRPSSSLEPSEVISGRETLPMDRLRMLGERVRSSRRDLGGLRDTKSSLGTAISANATMPQGTNLFQEFKRTQIGKIPENPTTP
eukprot:gene955-1160_t